MPNHWLNFTGSGQHQFTLWAVPTGNSREEAATLFLVVTPDVCRRWKGGALPLEQVDRIEPNPSIKKLGVLGLVEQPAVDLKNPQKVTYLSPNK